MDGPQGHAAAFLGGLSPELRPSFERDAELAGALEDLLRRAREPAWDFELETEGFLRHVAGRLAAGAELTTLAQLRAADLYLAYGCAVGDARALAVFDQTYGADIDLAIMRSSNIDLNKDEFRQHVRNKLFVSQTGSLPRIGDYAGRGELRGWVRVTVLRAIVDVARHNAAGKEVSVAVEVLAAVPSPDRDPELEYFQRSYQAQFEGALTEAFSRLSPRQRNLLRQHILHRLTIDQLGALYGVHRTTAFRWVEKARGTLLSLTRTALRERLKVEQDEFASIMRLAHGQLMVSVRRLFVSQLEEESET